MSGYVDYHITTMSTNTKQNLKIKFNKKIIALIRNTDA